MLLTLTLLQVLKHEMHKMRFQSKGCNRCQLIDWTSVVGSKIWQLTLKQLEVDHSQDKQHRSNLAATQELELDAKVGCQAHGSLAEVLQ